MQMAINFNDTLQLRRPKYKVVQNDRCVIMNRVIPYLVCGELGTELNNVDETMRVGSDADYILVRHKLVYLTLRHDICSLGHCAIALGLIAII